MSRYRNIIIFHSIIREVPTYVIHTSLQFSENTLIPTLLLIHSLSLLYLLISFVTGKYLYLNSSTLKLSPASWEKSSGIENIGKFLFLMFLILFILLLVHTLFCTSQFSYNYLT